jgi:ABC-type phosphate/phosphonate transport system permease subunit
VLIRVLHNRDVHPAQSSGLTQAAMAVNMAERLTPPRLQSDHTRQSRLPSPYQRTLKRLTVGYSGVIIGAIVGVAIGLLARYGGSTFDQVAMRVADAWLSFPYIVIAVIAIVWAVTIGSGMLNLVAIHAGRGWVEFAPVGRRQALAIHGTCGHAVRGRSDGPAHDGPAE